MTEILNAMKPCGLALLDYYNGQEDAVLTVRREDGDARAIRVQAFFRVSTALAIDQKALDVCHGRVLDVGAGTGIHSLALQGQGVEVCAIDVLPEACEIMRKRGLKDVHCADFRRFAAAKRFDTILILGRGLGMVETLAGLDQFLEDTHRHLLPQGQVLLSSLDVRCTANPVHLSYQDRLRKSGRYFGELRMQFEYEGQTGPMFSFLYVDPETLAAHAEQRGWSCDILIREEDGNY
ncbi:methyltransferase domain-containing protein, partial [Dehalococcoidia bacterium]|nr:methyltransferase domain-containing protein [Dehalococcoidia bacterium]